MTQESKPTVKRIRTDTLYDWCGVVKSFLWDNPVEIDHGIYLGNVSHSFFNSTLENFNIGGVVNVTADTPNYYDPEINYFNIRIGDFNHESIIGDLEQCYQFILNTVNKGSNVLIHCVFGRSRSVAVCLFYLMKRHSLSFQEAYDKIESIKPIINLNSTFADELKSYFGEPISEDPQPSPRYSRSLTPRSPEPKEVFFRSPQRLPNQGPPSLTPSSGSSDRGPSEHEHEPSDHERNELQFVMPEMQTEQLPSISVEGDFNNKNDLLLKSVEPSMNLASPHEMAPPI